MWPGEAFASGVASATALTQGTRPSADRSVVGAGGEVAVVGFLDALSEVAAARTPVESQTGACSVLRAEAYLAEAR